MLKKGNRNKPAVVDSNDRLILKYKKLCKNNRMKLFAAGKHFIFKKKFELKTVLKHKTQFWSLIVFVCSRFHSDLGNVVA